MVSEKLVLLRKYVLCLLVCFTCICTTDLKPTAICDVKCVLFVIVYLGIQVAIFDTLFDCYLNMIGQFLFAHC